MLFFIMITCLGITIAGKYLSSLVFMSINRNIHDRAVSRLIQTRMQFYDENTSGIIINRLSKDIQAVDVIVFNFLEMIDYIIKCSFSVFFIVVSSPVTILLVIFQLFYFYRLRKRIIRITRDCFRLKQMLTSPIVSLIQDSINGQVSMRAHQCCPYFLKQFMKLSDA